jgi:hypothetical protein
VEGEPGGVRGAEGLPGAIASSDLGQSPGLNRNYSPVILEKLRPSQEFQAAHSRVFLLSKKHRAMINQTVPDGGAHPSQYTDYLFDNLGREKEEYL